MSCDYQSELRKTVEQWFWDFCADVPRLTMTRFVFEKGVCGWSVQSTMGDRTFEMWNDRGDIWVKNIANEEVWSYPARDLGEHIFASERKKVRYLLELVQADIFLSKTVKPPVPFYQNNRCDGPVI